VYEAGKDDAAFKALDYLCCQGIKTKLVSEFLLKIAFEQIQPRGWCCVAEDTNGDMVGIARSYVYECMINGKPSPISYAFLIRTHPHYRRRNLAIRLTSQLFSHDVQVADVEYMSSWVVVDNFSSQGLQEKIGIRGSQLHGMSPPDSLKNFRCIGKPINFFSQSSEQSASSVIYKVSLQDQIEIARSFQTNYQFFPLDIEALFKSPLNLGCYVLKEKVINSSGQIEEQLLAYINVWNSGEVRLTMIRETDIRSDGAVLMYNSWHEDSERGQEAFKKLVEKAAKELSNKGFKFVFTFFSETTPFNSAHATNAQIDTLWQARVWYVVSQEKLDMQAFPNLFYDPRQCLV